MASRYVLFSGTSGGGGLDAEAVRDAVAAALVAGTNVSIVNDDNADTITVNVVMDQEVIRDTIGATLTGGTGIGVFVDDAGNTIRIDNTSGGAQYFVDVFPADQTGTTVMNTQVAAAVASVNLLYSTTRGSHTVSLRFAPGNFRITDPTVFDPLVLATSAKRSLTIGGPTELGKRGTLIIFASTVTATTDQTVGCLFRLVNNRQFTFRDIGFKSENANQTLFYNFCTTGTDEGSLYPEFPASSAQNSGRWRRIYVEGDWKVITGFDGGVRANLNSEMAFEDWTFSNSLTVSDAAFKVGYKLRDAVYLSTGISAPTAGTYTLTYNGSTTGSIAYNAAASVVQTALEALPTIGTGNVVVTASSTPTAGSYVCRFRNALAGAFNGTLMSTTTTGWGGVSWKVFLFPPQQDQFLNYSFRNNEFEYKSGDFLQINRGGCFTFDGYHSIIMGTSSGVGGTIFVMPEIATHADNACNLTVGGDFRPELRVSTAKFIDCSWHGVNKAIRIGQCDISVTAISGGATGATVKGMEVMAFRNAIDASQMSIILEQVKIPGYVTYANATTGAGGADLLFMHCRFQSWTTPTVTLFANQAALAADTSAAVRVLGSAKMYNMGSHGNGGADMSVTGTTPAYYGRFSV